MKRTGTRKEGGGPEIYRRMLLDKRQTILSGSGVKLEISPRTDRIAEDDQAQVFHDEFVSLQLSSLDHELLRLIDEALRRLGAGRYGLCLSCEERIPAKRLRALPWARYCVACEQRAGAEEEEDETAETEARP